MRVRDLFRIAVKDVMEQKDINQVKLAKAVDETPSNICEFLKGGRPLHHKKERIASFLGSTYMKLLKHGQILIGDNPELLSINDTTTIKVDGKKIKVSKLYSKIRYIFSFDSSERIFLIADIDKYYTSLSKKTKARAPKGKIITSY